MYKKVLTLVLVLAVSFTVSAQKLKKLNPNIVVIGIGAKNPTFNEAQYPDLKFYYTPGLKSQAKVSTSGKAALSLFGAAVEKFEGTPEFLAEMWNTKSNMKESFMIFDEDGLCFTQGYRLGGRGAIDKQNCINKKSIAKNVKALVKKGKKAKKAKKKMKLKKSNFMVGREFPDFKVSDSSGKEFAINDLVKGEKATIVVFFQISKDIDFNAGKESGKGKSGRAFGKAILGSAAGANQLKVFEKIESNVFEYDAREKN